MTQQNELRTQPIHSNSLGKQILIGAGIGLLLIAFFLFSVKESDPEWGKLWMVRPLIIVPLAGAMGAVCNYFIINFRSRVGINKTVAVILSVLVFIVGLWLGMVLGLDGTLWN